MFSGKNRHYCPLHVIQQQLFFNQKPIIPFKIKSGFLKQSRSDRFNIIAFTHGIIMQHRNTEFH